MRIGICASPANAPLARDAGADFIEPGVREFLVPRKPDSDFAELREAAAEDSMPIPVVNCFLPGDLKCVGPDARTGDVLDYAATAFARAGDAGVGVVVFGSGGSRRLPEGFAPEEAAEQFADLLKRMGPLAGANNVTVAVEPLCSAQCNFVNTLAEAAPLVRRVGHPAVRLVVDIFHMLAENEPPQEIARHADLVAHCHVAESTRRAPGTDSEDLRPYLRALVELGYSGAVSLECRWEDLAAEAGPAVACLRAQLADVGA
jgi:sugar phosphate isomerase/epimerase